MRKPPKKVSLLTLTQGLWRFSRSEFLVLATISTRRTRWQTRNATLIHSVSLIGNNLSKKTETEMSRRNSNYCKLSRTFKILWPRNLKDLIKKTLVGLRSRWSSQINEFREKVLEAKMNSKTYLRASCNPVKFLRSWLRNSMKLSED